MLAPVGDHQKITNVYSVVGPQVKGQFTAVRVDCRVCKAAEQLSESMQCEVSTVQ